MSKILIVGDAHFVEHLPYYHLVNDGREGEKQEVLDFIIKTFKDNVCDKVVFLGDQFDKRNNPSPVIKSFTRFIESFGDKPVYMIAGNHEKTPSGDSALDYLKEVSEKNWHIISNQVEQIGNMIFCPYFFKSELGEIDGTGQRQILKMLNKFVDNKKNILFIHCSISNSVTPSNQNVNLFDEVVLPQETLESYFLRIFGGHIHKPQESGRITVAGSIYNGEINEDKKYIYIYDDEKDVIEKILLPGRGIYRLINPNHNDTNNLPSNSIVKVFITERGQDIEAIKVVLSRFDGYTIVEQYPNERRLEINSDDLIDLNIENLLLIYADQKKIDKNVLLQAWNKIK